MQTFLSYKSYKRTAKTLDYRRLGKQRIEARDILYLCHRRKGDDRRVQFNKSNKQAEYLWKRYRNHPAVLMWENNINSLKLYYNTIVQEWVDRGYNNNLELFIIRGKIKHPDWLGNSKFHSLHRANLLRKNFDFYSRYNWKEEPAEGYYWPVRKEK